MSFLAPVALIGLLLAIPIILMYMLRLRRRELIVSSTYLWQQLLQDKEANTPWQRLRRNLLLILQLIILALLAFALARPFLSVPAISAARMALLIDASASMAATDGPAGETRFSQAQDEALKLIDALARDAEVSVIRVGDTPEVILPYAQDKAAAMAAVRSVSAGQGGADWLAAITLAAAGGQAVDDFTMVMLTDGGVAGLDALTESALPGRIRVVPVGQSDENVALTALAARSLAGGPPQVFAQVTNYGSQDAEIILTLRADDDPLPVFNERFIVPGGASLPFVSSRGLDGYSVLQATVTTAVNSVGRDLLTVDNTAWTVARAAIGRRVLLISEDNLFLEQVLRSLPGVSVFKTRPDAGLPAETFDLYVYDQAVPRQPPPGDVLLIGPPVGVPGWFGVAGEVRGPPPLEAETTDDRMVFVDFDAVNIGRTQDLRGVSWGDVLLRAGDTPLIVAGDRGGRQIVIFGFALRDTDLQLNIAFPILMSNLMAWFSPVGSIVNAAPAVGDVVLIQPPLEADAVRVTRPDGVERTLPVDADQIVYTDTSLPGVYRLEIFSGGTLLQAQPFAVNLFDPLESDIAPRDVSLSGTPVLVQRADEQGQFEVWPLLAALALAVLMLEWWIYHRRTRDRIARAAAPGRASAGWLPRPLRRSTR